MRVLNVAEDIVPVAQFKAQAKRWLAHVKETGQPLIITQNGRSAGVVLSPGEYDRLTYQRRFQESVDEGLADLDGGRVLGTEQLRRRLGLKRKGGR